MAKDKPRSKYAVIDFVSRLFLTIAIVALAYFFFISNENFTSELYLFNRKPIIVQTDTMDPVIKDGSMVVIKKAKIEDLKNHDVIAYYLDDRIVIHRVFIDKDGLKTKADTSKRFDLYEVNDDNLIGYVSLRVNLPIFKFLDSIDTDDGVSVDDVEI